MVMTARQAYITVGVLFLINLLNYMDRYTLAGVLPMIKKAFGLDFEVAGLLQTVFIVSYMSLAPIFGYLGDRYNRKIIMGTGILIWAGTTLATSFNVWLMLIIRGCVGIGEASYSTIAPTIIADMFSGQQRTKMLAFFYFAIPVGSGLGYVSGSQIAAATKSWRWAFRITPGIAVVLSGFCFFVITDPPRGHCEQVAQNTEKYEVKATTWKADMKALLRNKTYVWTTIGFTCVAFTTGALAFWAPTYITSAELAQGITSTSSTGLIFGAITCAAGITGVLIGAESSRRFRNRIPYADAIICAVGLLASAPFVYVSLFLAEVSLPLVWVLIFIGEVLINLNWTPIADILLYTVPPARRSTAEAFQILFSHLFGDAGSPYLIGAIADSITTNKEPAFQAFALKYALSITTFVCVLGGAGFLMASFSLEKDRKEAEFQTEHNIKNQIENYDESIHDDTAPII
ncbi:Protein spinster-like protein 1 [Trichoplax sp. H2]|nr:Protein spinster-like protein 1 [Trichoplax sp. H2]|eukprot:RDD43019.1 Protein spinster-like protein 1 [Trichoplax sp. H2]